MKKTGYSIYLAFFFLIISISFSSPEALCSAHRDTAPLVFVRHKKTVIKKAKLLRTQLIKTLTILEQQLTYWRAEFYGSRAKSKRKTIQSNITALESRWNHIIKHFGQLNRRITDLEVENELEAQDTLVQDIMHIIAHCLTRKATEKKGFICTPSSLFESINDTLINGYSDTVIRSCKEYLMPNFIERNWKKGLVTCAIIGAVALIITKNSNIIIKKCVQAEELWRKNVADAVEEFNHVLHKESPKIPELDAGQLTYEPQAKIYEAMLTVYDQQKKGLTFNPPYNFASTFDNEWVKSVYEGGGYIGFKEVYRKIIIKLQQLIVVLLQHGVDISELGKYAIELTSAGWKVAKLGAVASVIPFTLLTGYLTYRIVKTPHFPYYAKDLRFIFRNIDRLLTQHAGKNETISDAAHGELLYRVQKIRGMAHVKMASPEKEQFLEDLHDLSSPSLTGDQGLAIIQRIFRTYQFLSFTPINVS